MMETATNIECVYSQKAVEVCLLFHPKLLLTIQQQIMCFLLKETLIQILGLLGNIPILTLEFRLKMQEGINLN